MSGLPKTIILSPEEVREAIDERSSAIVDSVVACLGQAPPELAQDLILQGIHLVGGGGMLRGPRPAHRQRDRRARCTSSTPRSSASCSAPVAASRPTTASRSCSWGPNALVVARSSAAWRTCQSRSSRARARRRRPRGRRTGPARGRPGAARWPCRGWPARIAGRPAASPMDPRAATAASRTRASSCPVARALRAATAPGSGGWRSPLAQAATSTTVASSSSSSGSSDGPGVTREPGRRPRRPGVARPATASPRAAARSSVVRAPRRSSAPRAVARTSADAVGAARTGPWARRPGDRPVRSPGVGPRSRSPRLAPVVIPGPGR